MASEDQTVSTLSAERLGGPGAPDPQECSAHAMAVLAAAAGTDMRLTSLALDVTSYELGHGDVSCTLRVHKRARSILFASVEARSDGRLVYSAQGLFSRAL